MTAALSGKVALVTGASRGIGAVIAKRLAADGTAVALTYSASPERAAEVVGAIEGAGGRALAVQADAAAAAAVRAAVVDGDAARPQVVQPGPTATEMNPRGAFADEARTHIALQRYAQAEEIADCVACLASPGASFITGAGLAIDGGYAA
jgi:NAD(P)-dependent dehydrogenase (short-subunit alcohol dehydrogenase family)